MHLFPHFAPLPPASPAEAAQISALLRVAPGVIRYDRLTSGLALVAQGYLLLLYLLILATGLAARFRDAAERLAPGRLFLQGAATYLLIEAALFVGGLPLGFVRGWMVPKRFGLSNLSAGGWLWEHAKAIGVNAVVGALIAGGLLLLIRRSPRLWPVWFAAALAPVIALGIFALPLVVEPLFNRFTPLPPSSALYVPLHRLIASVGVGNAAVFIVDKSKQTNETNAYVNGFGPSLRIVLWDTLLRRMDTREVVAVTGHELGHYVEGHLVIGYALSVLGLFALFPLLRAGSLAVLARFGPRWRLRERLDDPAALALLLLSLQVCALAAQPITNAVSREIEHRADAYSLGTVRDRAALARSFVDLSKQNLEDPDPPEWEVVWFGDHPPLAQRVRYALEGEP